MAASKTDRLTVKPADARNGHTLPADELRTSELRYRRLFEAARDGILLLDATTLKITDANPFMTDLLEYTYSEFIGKELWELGFFSDKKASRAAFHQIQTKGYLRYDDLPLRTKNGDAREVEFVTNVYDEGRKHVIQCNIRDITQRKLHEAKSAAIEEGYRRLFEYAPDGIIIACPESYYLDANPGMCKMLGYSSSELIGMHASDIVSASELRHLQPALAEVKTATGYSEEWRFKRKDGSKFTGEVIARIMPDGNLLAMVRDITERQQAEENIRRSESRLNEAQSVTHIGSWSLDLLRDELVWSDEHYRIFGLRPEDIDLSYGVSLFENIIHKDDRDLVRNAMEHSRATLEPFDHYVRGTRPDGSIRLIHSLGFVDADEHGNAIRISGTAQDVTEHRRAEEALRESESRLRAIIDTEPECVKLTTVDCTLLEMNPAGLKMIDAVNFAQVRNLDVSTLVVEEDRAAFRDLTRRVFDGETGTLEFQITGLKGTERWLDTHAVPLKDGSGRITAMLSITRDITQRRASEIALRESNDNFHQLADNITDAFWIRSPDMTTIHYISPAFEEIWGRPVDDFYNHPEDWKRAILPEDQPAVLSAYAALASNAPDIEVEYRITRPNGEIRTVRSRGFQVRGPSGDVVRLAGIITDLTDQKRLEDQFRQSQKMEAIGVLAGGIAHDFNNMLTVINGYSDLVLQRLEPDDPNRSNVQEIKRAGLRAAMLTNQLLTFSRRHLLRPEVVDINEVVAETSNMLQRLIGEDVELVSVLKTNVGRIKVDPGQLGQVLMNLAVNARDAMPHGGKLTIETANIFVDPQYADTHVGVLPGAYVMLAVTDTGCGMSSELQEHIFEPFFTTKETGKGTGLGLSTVYGIVKQSGGGVFVYSEEDHGTTIKVFLPRVIDFARSDTRGVETNRHAIGTETVLLVEDEELVRTLLTQILESLGYNVRTAVDGANALKVFAEAGDIDLVITDVVMPRMGGRELVEKLLLQKPDLPILYTSGYPNDAIVRHGVLEMNVNFLQKPFALDDVARKVRDLLEGAKE
ncbi:MAG: PAS domain S-box protein [Pyrinomonadaceae bacterium]